MYFPSTTVLFAALLAARVNAHGMVSQITANGKTYTAPLIGVQGDPQFFYIPADNSPIQDPNSANTLCGNVATKPTTSLQVSAGTTLNYRWASGYSNEMPAWPHNTGPIFWYIAKCSNDCSSSTKWFKLRQDGFESHGVWKQADFHAGKTIGFTIPADLASGEYTIRHEIVNLASTAEMFPSCLNVKVTGSGSKSLSGPSASFPGAYSLSSPGLAVAGADVYGIFDNSAYKFPGPALAALGGSASSGGDNDNGGSSSSPTTSSTSGSTTTFVPVGNVGGNPDSETTTPTTTTTPSTSTTTSTDTDTDGGDIETVTSPTSSPSSTSTSTPPATGGAGLASCASNWTACNAKYKGTASDQANYNCQTEYVSCVQAAMGNNSSANVRRMHRRHRAVFGMGTH